MENFIQNELSNNYSKCLQIFIDNAFVSIFSYTSYGNPREYVLNTSLKNYLLGENITEINDLKSIKEQYQIF